MSFNNFSNNNNKKIDRSIYDKHIQEKNNIINRMFQELNTADMNYKKSIDDIGKSYLEYKQNIFNKYNKEYSDIGVKHNNEINGKVKTFSSNSSFYGNTKSGFN